MNPPRIVLDNSAALPAFFEETGDDLFDARLVNNRSKALIQAIRTRRVHAYVPPSFYREFLNVATRPVFQPGVKDASLLDHARLQWDDLLSLPLIIVPTKEIMHHSGMLTFDDRCPAPDSWYLATAVCADAEFWISHEHKDGLVAIASKHVTVRLLSKEPPQY